MRAAVFACVLALLAAACTDGAGTGGAGTPDEPTGPSAASSGPPAPPPGPDAVVVALAGDIATSDDQDAATARLAERLDPDLVLTLGDNAYPDGTRSDFARRYTPTWGRLLARTRPSPGNHDYHDEAGDPPYYFTYFAAQLPPDNGGQYYAFDAGTWRLYSLNCEIDCSASSAQVAWLRDDLRTKGAGRHKLAYLHRPRYSCGTHGSSGKPKALWRALLAARADVVASGHDHNYQRFPRMDADGHRRADGIVSFVAGTGGGGLYRISGREHEQGCALAQHTDSEAHGVLVLTLGSGSFSWRYATTSGRTPDSGTAATLDAGG